MKLLEEIDVAADTLAHFAAWGANRCDGTDQPQSAAYDFHAIEAMARRIGAIAQLHRQSVEEIGNTLCGHTFTEDVSRREARPPCDAADREAP